jgi:hypothetical protein
VLEEGRPMTSDRAGLEASRHSQTLPSVTDSDRLWPLSPAETILLAAWVYLALMLVSGTR